MGEEFIQQVLEDWQKAPLDERQRSAMAFLEKLTLHPDQLTTIDLAPLRQSGLDTLAIHEITMVCFLFSIMDRLADALGFDSHPKSVLKQAARAIKKIGYLPISIGTKK